jgi:hypothetical protein
MTTYQVQFVLPVDNPVSNVSMSKRSKVITFFVPINHPDAHKMGFMDLLASAELSGLIDLSTPLKNNRLTPKKLSSKTEPTS